MSKKAKWLVIATTIFIFLLIIYSRNNTAKDSFNTGISQGKKLAEEQTDSPTIPGINAVDVYGNLEKLGFSCIDPNVGAGGSVLWECKEETPEHLYMVEILGNSPSEILSVQATALNYSSNMTDNAVKDFLGYVASVPYTEADQVQARDWVKQNISTSTNTVINGVRFTIVGKDRSRILTITHENSDLD